jgi:hypothetical protein
MTRSLLGDSCQGHGPGTVPVTFPHDVASEGGSLRAAYRCDCGASWACWWDLLAAGWTLGDVDEFRWEAA